MTLFELCVDHLDGDSKKRSSSRTAPSASPYDLFLGVPKHRAPEVVLASGMTEDGYVPVDPVPHLADPLSQRLRDRRRDHGRRSQGRRLRRGSRLGESPPSP